MKTILVLTDFSERSEHAAEFAWQMAMKVQAEILLFNAFYYVPQTEDTYGGVFPVQFKGYAAFEEKSLEQLIELSHRLRDKFQTSSQENIPSCRYQNGMGDLADNVRDILNNENIWMIIMGDKRDDGFLTHLVFTSDASELIERASCPVLMIPEKANFHNMARMALALASFEQAEFKALKFVTQLAQPFKSEVLVLHVSEKVKGDKEASDGLLEEFYKQGAAAGYDKISFHDIKGDDITKSLLNFEQLAGLDLIALVHKKHPFYEQLFHKSTTKQLMGYHTIPLLVFPPAYSVEPNF